MEWSKQQASIRAQEIKKPQNDETGGELMVSIPERVSKGRNLHNQGTQASAHDGKVAGPMSISSSSAKSPRKMTIARHSSRHTTRKGSSSLDVAVGFIASHFIALRLLSTSLADRMKLPNIAVVHVPWLLTPRASPILLRLFRVGIHHSWR